VEPTGRFAASLMVAEWALRSNASATDVRLLGVSDGG